MSIAAESIHGLSQQQKRALLARLLEEQAARPQQFPLSFGQQRLWFLDQLAPGNAAYNIRTAVRLDGHLTLPALAASLREIVRRHKTLRTIFQQIDGTPVQVVVPKIALPFVVVDLEALPRAAVEEEMERLTAVEARRPFDLGHGPLLRTLLARLRPGETVFLLVMHHIVSDGWSLEVLIHELASLYRAFAAGEPSPLPDLPIQYVDYVRWQRDWLSGERLERELAYWKERLSGAPVLELPLDRPRPASPTFRGTSLSFSLPKQRHEELTALGRREGVTPFTVVLTAFAVLLHRYTGQGDMSIGCPIANRNRRELEGLIGFFANTLVLRMDLSGHPSFRQALKRVQEAALGAYAHQDVPLEKLVDVLQPQRDISRNPLFQVAFALVSQRQSTLELPGLTLTPISIARATAKFDLSFELSEIPAGVVGELEYSRDLFEKPSMARLLNHFERLVEGVVADPGRSLPELPLLSAAERAQLIQEWNDTAKERPQISLVHELFSWHAGQRPQATAVASRRVRLSYGELEARSNRLAHHLRSLGVGPDVLVAMCTDRTLDRVVGIVAVLKAGGAYVSLDPTYPQERLTFLLEDAGASVLLTEERFLGRLPQSGARVLCLDGDWESFQGPQDHPPELRLDPDNLAYVVYTSGSTGRPKGVEIPHAGLMNLVRWHQDLYAVGPDDRGTQVASPAFDASIWELWPYLAAGASLHIPDEEVRMSSPGMIHWWSEAGITLAYLMTPLAIGVLEERIPRELDLKVRALIIGGDRLDRGPDPQVGFRLMNHYGPAEYTVTSTVVAVPPEGEGSLLPTIGRPIDNTWIYILDRWQQPVPIRVSGELYVAGIGLARGYHGRPDLTAEKFVPDPFSGEPGARMYRTGDLVRYLPNGEIDFLGRLDHQVKLRGLRIELGEIEAMLSQHPAVRESAALVREDRPGDRRLVAYLVPAGESVPPADELRAFLERHLPAYMVPAAFVPLASLPLTPNGKVDRRALPVPDWSLERSYEPPRNRTEEELARIWGQVLRLERVGIHDNFFELGGDSILTIQVVSRAARAGLVLTARQLFENPTVAGLAAVTGTTGRSSTEQAPVTGSVPLTSNPRRSSSLTEQCRSWDAGGDAPPDFPLAALAQPLLERLIAAAGGELEDLYPATPVQQGMLFHSLSFPDSGVYVEQHCLTLEGKLDPDAFARAWGRLVQRHAVLRTIFLWRDCDLPLQAVIPHVQLSWDLQDWSVLPEREREDRLKQYIAADRKRGFDLGVAPLLRLALIRWQPDRFQFIWTHPHLLLDGWSLPILLRELFSLYQAERHAEEAQLGVAPKFRSYVAWLREQDASEAEQFWRQELAGLTAPTPLAVDHPAVTTAEKGGSDLRQQFFSRPAADALAQFARRHRLTLNALVQGAWALLLHRYSGERDIVFGTVTSGRSAAVPGIESMVGLFINTLPARIKIGSDVNLLAWLRDLQEHQARMRQYEHSALSLVQGCSAVPRNLPLFESILAFENYPVDQMAREQAGRGLGIVAGEIIDQTNYPLTVVVISRAGLLLRLLYESSRFDGSTIVRMLGHLEQLLLGMIDSPDRMLESLSMLSPAERQQLQAEWNDTVAPGPADVCLHRLIESQVRQAPEAVALVFEGACLTYAGLNQRANRLARHLRRLGVQPEVPVGVCLERSLDLVVALLGILKAGGAYVPLDPSYPRLRLAAALADMAGACETPVVLTASGSVASIAGLPVRTMSVLLDSDTVRTAIAAEKGSDLTDAPAPDSLAYVIFTSGSTGRPKGAMNTHRAIVNRLLWMQQAYGLHGVDRVLQKTPMSFDVSVWEFFWPVMTGACLVVARPEGHKDSAYLTRSITEQEITTLHFVPSMLQVFLDEPSLASCRAVERVIVSGEALPPDLVRRLYQRLPWVGLHNLYGPTEAAVDVTFQPCRPEMQSRSIPIGRPITNVYIRVLDVEGRPVPVGVQGELHIGGTALARGYLNRPDLTAQRFVPCLEGAEPGERLYRTGDLARLLPGGEIEYLGRTDSQIKLRGVRIELQEIEVVLSEHPAVREAAVVARSDRPGETRLAAYVVTREETPRQEELRSFLRERLPEAMIPGIFVQLAALPLLPNGKLDRKALPAPEPEAEVPYVPPRSPVEEVLAGIWSEILGVERVGAHDGFFELGGHSLLATQLASRVRGLLGMELPVRAVFEAPTLAALAASVALAMEEKRDRRLPPIQPRDVAVPPPLSFAQERLWFLEQLQPGNAAYHIGTALRLPADADVTALQNAIDELVRRHAALRTTFDMVAGQPVQLIAADLSMPLPEIDLSALPPETGSMEHRRLAREQRLWPFDLRRGPMWRAILVEPGAAGPILLVAMHHIISDGWSLGILVQELEVLYKASRQGRPSPLPDLPIQYADFACWQRQWLAGEALEAELAYWRTQLSGAAVLELATDRPRPAVQTSRGRNLPLRLGSQLIERLHALSRGQGATLFMTLLAAFQVLLARYASQSDISVGTPVAGRNRLEIERLIGLFLNTLVLRNDLSGEPRFVDLLRQVRETTLAAYAHQDLPFEKLVAELQPERDLSRTPLFQVMFVLQNLPVSATDSTELRVDALATEGEAAQFDLILMLMESKQGLTGFLNFNRDLFDGATTNRMMGQFTRLLARLPEGSDDRLSQLTQLSGGELQQIIVEWNDTAAMYGRELCLHQLFERRAEGSPGSLAVVAGEHQLTYGEVDRQANQVAHHLRFLGIGPGDLVAVLLDRSASMIPCLLGILKSGAAYVPLETRAPEARMRWILEALRASVVVVSGPRLAATAVLVSSLPGLRHVVCLDSVAEPVPALGPGQRLWTAADLVGQPVAAPAPRAEAGDMAYIIFTSGSTGTPKGVMVRHRPAINLIEWVNGRFAIGGGDRGLFTTSLGFDLSVYDIFGILAAGGSIRVASEAELGDPESLARILAYEPITFWDSAPAALEQLVPFLPEAVAGGGGAALRLVFLSGDWIPLGLPDQVRSSFPSARIVSLGGATEATVWSNVHPVEEVRPEWKSIPYGRPIQNARYYVLDGNLAACPVGTVGDLYIGGECLSSGYVGEAALTAERYVPDPFARQPGAVMYRTGDRSRHWKDGTIEFLGRSDHQVKIRGFRIELGEIESALSTHPGVRAAMALALGEGSQGKYLVAYVVPLSSALEARELREHLQARLPEYMVPNAFLFLDALPVTANGKLDRKAHLLPEPKEVPASATTTLRSPVEEIVAEVWKEALQIDRVGPHDDFFGLGGHSLVATRMVSRLRETFGVELPLRSLFERPTVGQLTELITAGMKSRAGLSMPPIEPVPRDGDLPLSFAQGRLWLLHKWEPASPAYNLSVALRLKGPLDVAALWRSLDEVVERHESLRTIFPATSGVPKQVVVAAESVPLPQVDLRGLPATEGRLESQRLVTRVAQIPFDLTRGPVLRFVLSKLADEEHVIVASMHHIVSDGWSLGILVQEVAVLYRSFSEGLPSPLPAPVLQYGDFASWQRQWLVGETLEAELAYWRTKLEGAPASLELPTDRPRPNLTAFAGASLSTTLSGGLAAGLRSLSRRNNATLFMTLLAAMKLVLARWCNQEDIVLGTVVANRAQPQTENLIGCFMNFLALRTRISGDETLPELFANVKTTVLDAFVHESCPFEKVVEAVNPERKVNQNPVYNVGFVLQNYPRPPVFSDDLEVSPIAPESRTSLLDLRLVAQESTDGIELWWEYSTALLDRQTIDRLRGFYLATLEWMVADPESRVGALVLPRELEVQAAGTSERNEPLAVMISATFTAEPVAEALRFWMEELEIPCRIDFAPYNQVFQQLLDPSSRMSKNRKGINVILMRIEDWRRDERRGADLMELERNVDDLIRALVSAVDRCPAPHLVFLCPASAGALADEGRAASLRHAAERLKSGLKEMSSVDLVTDSDLLSLYPVARYDDGYGERIGAVPYAPQFFVALGTMLARKIYALRSSPHKVVALDCDGTLWRGVCAEDGAMNVVIDPARRALQELMVAKQKEGMLLCLCSKNHEDDVLEVFNHREDMPLKWHHILKARLNWAPKSENLKALAKELQLGLESFIFIDDNPLECAEVESNCPEVLTLLLPENEEEIPQFLRHVWAFDSRMRTAEDANRTELYRAEAQRESLRLESLSFDDFMQSLDLQVDIEALQQRHVSRVAQLTERTNQFNLTMVRRSEAEIHSLLTAGAPEGLVVTVRDRFGDYGLVGVMLYVNGPGALEVDTFLLSCRALGRGVEHRMLARLGEFALERAHEWVKIPFRPTPRNRPAFEFLESVGSSFRQGGSDVEVYRIPARWAAGVGGRPGGGPALHLESQSACRVEKGSLHP